MTSEIARKARREYMKQYREKNGNRIRAKKREHYRNNPDKYKEYQVRYWEKKGQEIVNG